MPVFQLTGGFQRSHYPTDTAAHKSNRISYGTPAEGLFRASSLEN
jgi:hypothetical protein